MGTTGEPIQHVMVGQFQMMGGVSNPAPPAGPISWGLDALSWLLMRLHDLLIVAGIPSGTGGVWLSTILLFPLLLRTLLLPLFIQQVRGAARLSVIQKELAQIREDAAGDRERMHREMTAVYARENVSPFASCLPFVIQLPVYSGVFWVLHGAALRTPRGAAMDFHDAWNLAYTQFFGEYLSVHGWRSLLEGSPVEILHAVALAAAVALLTWVSMVTRIRMPGVPAPQPTRARTTLRVVLPLLIFVFSFIMPVAVVLFGASTRIVVWVQRLILMLILRARATKRDTTPDPANPNTVAGETAPTASTPGSPPNPAQDLPESEGSPTGSDTARPEPVTRERAGT